MAFEVSQFSTKGLELLGQLSSHKSLVIKRIFASETQHSVSDFDQTPFWWAQQTANTGLKVQAELASAGHDKDTARLTVKFTPLSGTTTETIIKTIVIEACGMESGAQTEDIIYCGVSDSKGITVLGFRDEGIQASTAVSLYFKFNNASSITVETNENPDFVLHSELDRFVSCHLPGSQTFGEGQKVLGNKYFKDGITLDNIEYSTTGEYDQHLARLSITDDGKGFNLEYHNPSIDDDIFTITSDNGVGGFYSMLNMRPGVMNYAGNIECTELGVGSIYTDDDNISLQQPLVPHKLENDSIKQTVTIGTEEIPFYDGHFTNLNITNTSARKINALNITGDVIVANRGFQISAIVSSSVTDGVMMVNNGVRCVRSTGTDITGCSTMFTNYNSIAFSCNQTTTDYNYNNATLYLDDNKVQVLKKLEVKQTATFKRDVVVESGNLSVNGEATVGKLNIANDAQFPLARLNPNYTTNASNNKITIAVPIGSIIGVCVRLDALTTLGYIQPGQNFSIAKETVTTAMWYGTSSSQGGGFRPTGYASSYNSGNGEYIEAGTYVALTGAARSVNNAETVFLLFMRVA